MSFRVHAPYMEWAKHRSASRFDLAGSNGLGCSLDDLPGARDALALSGKNDDGYAPLVEAIAARYAVMAAQITNSQESAPARSSLCASACLVSLASRISTRGSSPSNCVISCTA